MAKKALVLALTLSMVLGLTACGGQKQNDGQVSADGNQQVENTESESVNLVVWGAADDKALLEKQIANFEKAYEGQADFYITVETVAEEEAHAKVLGNMAEAADVFIFRDPQLSPLVAAGALSPVQVPDAVEREVTAYSFEAASFEKTLYAYPMATAGGYLTFFNKSEMTAAEASTVDSLIYKADALGKKFTTDWSSAEEIYVFIGSAGLYIRESEDGRANETNIAAMVGQNQGRELAQGFADMIYEPAFASMTYEESLEGVKNGEVVAFIAETEKEDEIRAVLGENFGVTKLPQLSMSSGNFEVGCDLDYRLVGVNAYTKHEDWAHKLATYLTNEESQTLRLKEKGDRPCNAVAATSTEAVSDPMIKAMNVQEKFCYSAKMFPGYEQPLVDFMQFMIETRFEPYEDLVDEETETVLIETEDRVTDLQPYVMRLQEAIINNTAF